MWTDVCPDSIDVALIELRKSLLNLELGPKAKT